MLPNSGQSNTLLMVLIREEPAIDWCQNEHEKVRKMVVDELIKFSEERRVRF